MKASPCDSVKRCIAVFDFDGTLAAHDSLWPFLVAVAGLPRCLYAMACGVLKALLLREDSDRRTVMKEVLLSKILAGRQLKDLGPAIERMRTWPRWLDSAEALRRHAAQGCHILIATGGLDLYVKEMLGELPYHAILCTEMEVCDGALTGRMLHGNCVRLKKAELVAAYLKEKGPYAESWAYGNAPHDLPMMELTTHRIII